MTTTFTALFHMHLDGWGERFCFPGPYTNFLWLFTSRWCWEGDIFLAVMVENFGDFK